jgi:hypothetical protein
MIFTCGPKRTARLSDQPDRERRPQVNAYLVMRGGSAGRGDWLGTVELETRFLALFPGEEFD